MSGDVLGFVVFERFTGAGDHFRTLGPFPTGAIILSARLVIGPISSGTAGDLSFQASLGGIGSADAATLRSGASVFSGPTTLNGIQRLLVQMGTAGDVQRFDFPLGVRVGTLARGMSFNVNLETVTLADVLVSVRVRTA